MSGTESPGGYSAAARSLPKPEHRDPNPVGHFPLHERDQRLQQMMTPERVRYPSPSFPQLPTASCRALSSTPAKPPLPASSPVGRRISWTFGFTKTQISGACSSTQATPSLPASSPVCRSSYHVPSTLIWLWSASCRQAVGCMFLHTSKTTASSKQPCRQEGIMDLRLHQDPDLRRMFLHTSNTTASSK
jgi:hypothetical protein